MRELAVIMPVYNEEGAIGAVLSKWTQALDAMGIDYQIHAYNDGSKDNTLMILNQAAASHERIIVHDKPNSGHGPTILEGYRQNCETAEWLFQIDSDDEMGPESFAELWNRRNEYDFLLGRRDGRKQALPRKIISFVSRLSVRMLYGKTVWDVNAPYRLMRSESFKEVYQQIPADTFAPNVIISGMAGHNNLRLFETPVPQKDRTTGEVSIKKWKLAKAAMKSFRQTVGFALENKSEENTGPYKFKKSHIWGYALLVCLFSFLAIKADNVPLFPHPNYDIYDNAVFRYCGFVIANGGLPYVDCFDHKGPCMMLINAAGYLINKNYGIWILQMLALAVSLFYSIKLLVHLTNFTGVVFSIILAYISFYNPCNTVEGFAFPFIIMSLYYLFLYIDHNGQLGRLQIVLSGIGCATVFLIRPNMVGLWVGFCLYVLLSCLYHKKYTLLLKQIIYFLLGLCVIVVPISYYFLKNNVWNDFIYQYFTFNLQYTYAFTNEGPRYDNIIHMILVLLQKSSILLSVLLTIMIPLSKNNRTLKYNTKIFLILCFFLYMFCIWISRSFHTTLYGNYCPRYFLPVMPFLLTSFAVTFFYVFSCIKNGQLKKRPTILLYLLPIFIFSIIAMNVLRNSIHCRKKSADFPAIQWVKDNVSKNDVVMSYGLTSRIFLDTGIVSATKYTYFPPVNPLPDRIVADYTKDIQGIAFKYLITSNVVTSTSKDGDLFETIVLPIIQSKNGKIVYQDKKYTIYEM